MARVWGIANPDDLLTYRAGTYALMLERLGAEADERERRKHD